MNNYLLALVLYALPMAVNAAERVYTVDRANGIGTVSGTITTDGAIGVVSASNILPWELTIFDGIDTHTIRHAAKVCSGRGFSPGKHSFLQKRLDSEVCGVSG